MQISRRDFLKALGRVTLGCGLVGVGGCTYGTRVEVAWLATERVKIPLKRLPSALEGLRIVLLSDFHLHPFTQLDFIRQVVASANDLKPDLVLLAGDYVLEKAESIFDLAPVLSQLDARYGVFAALGNHDLWTDVAVVRKGLHEAGVPLLINAGVPLDIGGGTIYLAGLDDGWSGRPDLNQALDACPADVPVILLAHEPDFADRYAQDTRVSVQLSGHSHGGQVRLPGVGALVLPNFARKYDAGLYRVADLQLYTSRGIGVIGPPVRINCRPELTEITLVGDV